MNSETVLIIGGGAAGLAAAGVLAERDIGALIVEREAVYGGRAATYGCKATEDCSRCNVCLMSDLLAETGTGSSVSLVTGAQVTGLSGQAGSFRAEVTREPVLVDSATCVQCGACLGACPEGVEAIEINPTPRNRTYTIDRGECLHFQSGSCSRCMELCPVGAIDLEAGEEREEHDVQAVIVATGFQPFPAETLGCFGYGDYEGVVTAYDLEQEMAGSRSPAELYGDLERIAFLQCAGSRDERNGNPYCSRICCGYALRLARHLNHELEGTEVGIYYIDLQNFGRDYRRFVDACQSEGVELIRGRGTDVVERNGRLSLIYEDVDGGRRGRDEADRIVLSVGLNPNEGARRLYATLGIAGDEHGFVAAGPGDDVLTKREGIFAAGACTGPRDIASSTAQGKQAAYRAILRLRGRSAWKTG